MQTLVEFDLPDLDTVLDMLFTAEKMNSSREVAIDTFREWILRDIKVPISDRDLQLFIKANPSLNRQTGYLDKQDLVQILGESFRQFQFDYIEKKRYQEMRNDSLTIDPANYDMDRSARAMNIENYRNQATTP